MNNALHILIINQHNIDHELNLNDPIIETSNFEDSMRSVIKYPMDILIFFLNKGDDHDTHSLNILDFISKNLNDKKRFYFIVNKGEFKYPEYLHKKSNTFFYDYEQEKNLKFTTIKKQIQLIRENKLLLASQKCFIELLSVHQNTLVLNPTLNAIHALIKENLNLISLKNGKYFLNDILNGNSKKEHRELEHLLLSTSKHINTIDNFLQTKYQDLNTFAGNIRAILKLYYNAYDFVFTSHIEFKTKHLPPYIYLLLNLIVLHILHQDISIHNHITVNLKAVLIENKPTITFSFKADKHCHHQETHFIKLSQILMYQFGHLHTKEHSNGFVFTISL